MKKWFGGFSLIEVMVVIAIMGILLAIAVPQYSEYVRKSSLVEANTNLSDWRVRMEQYYQDNRTYLSAGTCGVAVPTGTFFTYTCAAATTDTYTLQADGKGTGKATGFTYTINQQNQRVTVNYPTGFATVAKPAPCWITSKGASSC